MEDFEDKAREIMKEHGSPASLADYGYDQDEPIYFEDDVLSLLVSALSPPEGYVSREEMLAAMDRAFYDGMSKAEPQIPEGYVLVQVLDADRLCNHVTHSPSSALAARRVQGLIKASRGLA